MINGLGVVGWGVGGIEAEAGMLGQPVYFLTPEVVGVHMTGALREGVTATDLALHITQMLRAQKVVGKFVEFYGAGAASLPVPDRATIGNMAPEYGATMGFFPVDAESVNYLRGTGRTDEQCGAFESLFPRAENVWHAAQGRNRLQRRSRTRPWRRPTERGRTETPAGSDQSAASSEAHFDLCWSSHCRTAATERRLSDLEQRHFGASQRHGAETEQNGFDRSSQDQGIEPGDERNKVEMVTNRPTPDAASEIEAESQCSIPSWPKPDRPRQRADRRDHQLHEHEQSRA